MKSSFSNIIVKRILICILPFAVIFSAVIIAEFTLRYIRLPGCILYNLTGIYCPGCGNTRAVSALLKGDILLSLKENAAIAAVIIICFLYYIELFCKAFGIKGYKFPLRSKKVLFSLITVFTVYYIARNFIPYIAPI